MARSHVARSASEESNCGSSGSLVAAMGGLLAASATLNAFGGVANAAPDGVMGGKK